MVDQSVIVLQELTDDFDLENELFEDENDLTMLTGFKIKSELLA